MTSTEHTRGSEAYAGVRSTHLADRSRSGMWAPPLPKFGLVRPYWRRHAFSSLLLVCITTARTAHSSCSSRFSPRQFQHSASHVSLQTHASTASAKHRSSARSHRARSLFIVNTRRPIKKPDRRRERRERRERRNKESATSSKKLPPGTSGTRVSANPAIK